MILKYNPFFGGSYSESVDYLIYQHDPITKAKLYDENGNRLIRPVYLMDGIGCTPSAFPRMAEELNREFRKNLDPDERNMISFIISYHPDDVEHGHLDIYRAHEVSMEWARRCLPGMLGVICTHHDGDHQSGNYHTHILLCSLKYTDEISDSMKHPYIAKRGARFHPSFETWREFYTILDEIAQREGLHSDYVPGGALKRVNDREYHVRWHGQKKLEEKNRQIIASGGIPQTKTFRTEKEKYRFAVEDSCMRSRDLPEFEKTLQEDYGIRVEETDGKWRYIREGDRGYSAGTLGSAYFREKILSELSENQKDPERIESYLEQRRRERSREKWDLEKNSLPGFLETLSPPYRDDITGDIGKIVLEKGLALPTGAEQVMFLQPFAEAVRYLKSTHRSLKLPDLGEEEIHREIEDETALVDEAKGELAEQEKLRFFRNALQKHSSLKEALAASEDPERFRQEHRVKLQILEAAEEYLKGISPKTPEEQREELWHAGFRLRVREESLEYLKDDLSRIHRIKRDLNPIRPELEKCQEERERRKAEQARLRQIREAEERELEERLSGREKRLIPMDYER